MKNYIIIGVMGLILSGCAGRKHAAPCKQCPHYTEWHKSQILEYQTMNPEVNTAINKIESNGYKKFNKSNSETRGIIF